MMMNLFLGLFLGYRSAYFFHAASQPRASGDGCPECGSLGARGPIYRKLRLGVRVLSFTILERLKLFLFPALTSSPVIWYLLPPTYS